MTGRDLRLTDEQVALVHRLQRGQFGDSGFNPYEVGNNGWPYSLKFMNALPPQPNIFASLHSQLWTSSAVTS